MLLLIDIFLTRPGDGEPFVYFPVETNATLTCIVNAKVLLWSINGDNYNSDTESSLNPRRIYFRITPETSVGITESYIKVFGDRSVNNNISICCRSLVGTTFNEACTTLIIYGILSIKD